MLEPTTPTHLPSSARDAKDRSMGTKLLIVCGLALGATIPALFVSGVVDERSERAASVVHEISADVGGPQSFLGPTLAIPYHSAINGDRGVYFVFPAQASADVNITTEERRRSLFRVPVYKTEAQLSSSFDLAGVPHALPVGSVLEWDGAELVVGVSDPRGALADATLISPAGTATLTPAQVLPTLSFPVENATPRKLTLLGEPTPHLVAGATFTVKADLRFSGAQHLAVLAYGESTSLSIQGNWPHPGFDGWQLPATDAVTSRGFSAKWSIPFIARGVPAEGTMDNIAGLNGTELGVSLIELATPYQSVTRSLKYAPLFISLVFLSCFLFEATTRKRVHPAQYVLVGTGQLLFYLLLLSFAEHIGFDFAYLIAGVATVGLLSLNARWMFASRLQGYRAMATFGLLYMVIFGLLRLEDNALLVGAVTSFLALAGAMYLTRNLDWYSSLGKLGSQSPEPTPLWPQSPQ